MGELLERQQRFAVNIAKLILWLYDEGYKVTFGEAHRTPEQAAIYAKKGLGSKFSNHIVRLAIDLMLFKDDTYLRNASDYAKAGAYWKGLDPANRWGGDFKSKDGNHFSVEWEGRA